MQIEVIRTQEDFDNHVPWFVAGDLSEIDLDSETMGKNWYRVQLQIEQASEELAKVLKKEQDTFKKEALNHRKNILAAVQVSTKDDRCLVFIMKDPKMKELVQAFLKSLMAAEPVWILHNAKFDLHQFLHHLDLRFDEQKIHDTQINQVLIVGSSNYEPSNLEHVSKSYPLDDGLVKEKSKVVLSNWWSKALTDEQIRYMSIDVFVLHRIKKCQMPKLMEKQLFRVRLLESRLTSRLIHIENTGLSLDRTKMVHFAMKADEVIKKKMEVYASVFNDIEVTKPAQILQRIKDYYGITPMKTEYNAEMGCFVEKESADKKALLLADLVKEPAVRAYLDIKEIGKNLSTVRKWLQMPDGERLYVNFFQLPVRGDDNGKDGGARTGRMSTSPQVQNWDNFMKQFAVADDGYVIWSSDYSQIELRLIASYADDPTLRKAFNEGRSPHLLTTCKAFGMTWDEAKQDKKEKGRKYRTAKEINFGFPFGMGGPTFCRRTLDASGGDIRLSDEEGWKYRRDFLELYNRIPNYWQRQFAFACLNGYVTTRSGRRREYNKADRPVVEQEMVPFWDPFSGQWVGPYAGPVPILFKGQVRRTPKCTIVNPEACWRAADWKWKNMAYNSPVQGTAADTNKEAAITIVDELDPKLSRMFAQVHDSNDGYCREDAIDYTFRIVDRAMKDALEKYMPDVAAEVEHSIGRCWANEPKSLTESDHGLWVPVNNPELEFQKEYTLESNSIIAVA